MLRHAAWTLLRGGPEPSLRRLPRIADEYELDARDRGLLRQLVTTSWRRLGSLRAIANHLARTKPKADLAAFLHVGLAQLFFLDRIPDHAAVAETVEACVGELGLNKGRVVNACLRRAIELRTPGTIGDPRRDLVGRDLHLIEPVFRDPEQHPHLWAEDALSMPAPLMKAWSQRHGAERARVLAELALAEPPLSARVLRGDVEELLLELAADDLQPIATAGRTLLFEPGRAGELLETDAFARGAVVVQGRTASDAAELVGAQEGDEVLDLCSAPGGKTVVLAASGARVTACDVDAQRLERVQQNLARTGLSDRVELIVSDGTRALGDRTFDAVLVDAPCSNTGVLAARPEARWRYGPATQRSLNELQTRLALEAADRVRPGGRLVWSTCSLEPSENAARVRALLAARPDFALEEAHEALPDPDDGRVDGGYAARLVRPATR